VTDGIARLRLTGIDGGLGWRRVELALGVAWRHLRDRAMGLAAPRPDVEALLAWTLDDTAVERFLGLPEEVRGRIAAQLENIGGSAVGLVMGAVAGGHGSSVVALGLVLGVVFADAEERELRDAAVRLEPIFGRRVERQAGLRLAGAAGQLVGRDAAVVVTCQVCAAEWLERLHIEAFARLSDDLAAGFEQRLADAAEALSRTVASGETLSAAEEAVDAIFRHGRARQEAARAERARMALRLVRWLGSPEAAQARFPEAALSYLREGGFVDLARTALFSGDHRSDVSAAFGTIMRRATERRERENEAFARALERWNREGASEDAVVPVEQFIDRIMTPLARASNVLLIVVDGLSHAVHRRLFGELVRLGWTEIIAEGRSEAPPLIAALPSLTEVSRASLLSGRLVRGKAADERTAFAHHSALAALSRVGRPPLLFHKGGLGQANGLSEDVRAAIADAQQRVVALVHNVIDDQLDGADQLEVQWSLDDLRFVRALLREAREAGRVVVLASDHGHTLEHDSVQHTAEGGARWRRADGASRPFELLFEGGRVLAPEGERRVVLPWSETVRYGAKSRGYHGGATPQEVVAPLAVLTTGTVPAGWYEAPPVQPEWWEQAVAVPAAPARSKPRPPKARGSQSELVERIERAPARTWIDRLLASQTYAAQKRLAGRVAPRDEDIARLLQVLDERGGRLSETALAQALCQPVLRMSGFISAAARVLNVDQSCIVHLDRVSQTVTLERALLERQFELGKI
jgi:hypothetical protein